MSNSHNIMSYGERLPPHIVDARAKSGYERPYAMYPRTKDPADGFQAINYARLANAVNRVAWWLEEHVNEPKKDNYAFAYFGPNDLRYIIFVLAAMKTERKASDTFPGLMLRLTSLRPQILIASLRNTVDAQLSLFEKANCKALVSCSSLSLVLQPLFSASENVQKIQAPDLDEVLAEDEVPHYAYEKTFDEVAETIFLVLHTSGSSGNPKPIYWTIRFLCNTDSGHLLPTGEGTHLTKSFFTHQNALILLPCFHVCISKHTKLVRANIHTFT
jgi:acyl-coenzyme A synthetase/AMP-(fatty) acid ligase